MEGWTGRGGRGVGTDRQTDRQTDGVREGAGGSGSGHAGREMEFRGKRDGSG